MKNTLKLPALLLLSFLSNTANAAPALPDVVQLKSWGEEALQQARTDFYLPERALYAEEWKSEGGKRGPAFMWGCGVMLTALGGAAQNDKNYRPWLEEYVEKLDIYWNPLGPTPGYDVLPVPKPVDRYYDDNAWLALALIDDDRDFGGKAYLTRARKTLDYILSGWDDKLGGGIYWKEAEKSSKNTCINAPAAVACYEMFRTTRQARYREWGDKILDWTLANLRDPFDGLMWDNIKLDGKMDRTKWSYNTALTFRALMLRSILEPKPDKAAQFRIAALKMADAALEKWQDPQSGALKDGGRFAHLLVESLLACDRIEGKTRYRPQVLRALTFLHEQVRDAANRYPEHWDKPQTAPLQKCELINQASAARAYFATANALAGRKR